MTIQSAVPWVAYHGACLKMRRGGGGGAQILFTRGVTSPMIGIRPKEKREEERRGEEDSHDELVYARRPPVPAEISVVSIPLHKNSPNGETSS